MNMVMQDTEYDHCARVCMSSLPKFFFLKYAACNIDRKQRIVGSNLVGTQGYCEYVCIFI